MAARRITDSSIDRITRVALRTLEEVVARAECEIVPDVWRARLALEWLVAIGVAQPWQMQRFIAAMSDPVRDAFYAERAHYIRATMLSGVMDAWYQTLGLKRSSGMARQHLQRRYAADLIDSPTGARLIAHMCNRYSPGERTRIEDHFSARRLREFNDGPPIVHPREPGWVVRQGEGGLVLDQMSWGFPVVLTGKRGQPLKPRPVNNARFDKLATFWRRWATPENRCLIPAERYAEAVGPPGAMTTTWLGLKSTPIFAWAGLWGHSDEWGDVYTGVMTDNAPDLARIHDRSPVILARDDWEKWLTAPLEDLYRFDRPWPAEDVRIEETAVLWKNGGAAPAVA